jgi:hypothetical protein
MIVYQATKSDFTEDVFEDRIETKILDFFTDQQHQTKSLPGGIQCNTWNVC